MMSMVSEDGHLIVCSCFYCRKREAYWAADLLLVYGDIALEDFGRRCQCGNSDGTRTTAVHPSHDLVGRMELMRPVGWEKEWSWRREWLELPVRPLPDDIDQPKTATQIEIKMTPRTPPVFEDWTKPAGSMAPARPRYDRNKRRS